MGWSVWCFFVPCLALGVKLFLHSGSSFTTKFGLNCWDRLAKHKATFWFVEPGTLDHMEKLKIVPSSISNFDHLKTVCIAGSPVKAQNVKYIQDNVKKDLFVASLYATRGLLVTDLVILNHDKVTWTTPELAPPLLTTAPHQREDVSALDRFNVHHCPTRRIFSGTGFELVTKQTTVRYLYLSATAATSLSPNQGI
ncbi:acetoacetyl-CoA synthetase [Trichonephila clavipes]|nr:acetoacetyl-CoA synthetase [Trichonephila clavipes]